jgi:hypothetical protein
LDVTTRFIVACSAVEAVGAEDPVSFATPRSRFAVFTVLDSVVGIAAYGMLATRVVGLSTTEPLVILVVPANT